MFEPAGPLDFVAVLYGGMVREGGSGPFIPSTLILRHPMVARRGTAMTRPADEFAAARGLLTGSLLGAAFWIATLALLV
jgi:hypothetical protein